MEAKILREQMTQGEWGIDENFKGDVCASDNTPILSCGSIYTNIEIDNSNAAAIVLAVNSTFGKGINPEKVSELYDMLDLLLHHAKMSHFNRQRVTDLLTSAKL